MPGNTPWLQPNRRRSQPETSETLILAIPQRDRNKLTATCRFCNHSAGFLRKQHPQCHDLHAQGMREMTDLAAQAAGTASFNESALRNTLQAIALRARATEDDISQAIADGFAQGVEHAMLDGTLTADEETNLRLFRDKMVQSKHG